MFLMIYKILTLLHWGPVILWHFAWWTTLSLQNFSQSVLQVKQIIHKSLFCGLLGLDWEDGLETVFPGCAVCT